jgi:Nuclease-related domain
MSQHRASFARPYTPPVKEERVGDPTPARESRRRLRLRYAGVCDTCATPLVAGTEAYYDPSLRTVRCLSCSVDASDEDPIAIDVGAAGGSAAREYERRVDRRAARVKERFGTRIGGVLLALTDEPQSTRAWARGSEGERELADALADVDGIGVLHDRRVPGTRGNIDHVVVAPAGVFVVDAKRYEGTIRVRDVGGLFKRDERLFVGRRDCSRLAANMTWQVDAVARALAAAKVEPAPPITPVLCFVHGDWPLLFPPETYQGVRLEGTRSIKKLITRERVLDGAAINRITKLLAVALPPK